MTYKLKIRKIGNSAGVTLPKQALEQLHVRVNDHLFLVETKDGFLLTPYDATFEAGLAAFAETRVKYRNALRKLAE